MIQYSLPLIGICAFSGTGKTTLLTQLIPLLNKKDLRIGIVKHAHHSFDIDHPGKDSYELRHAGASQVAVASRERIAWIKEYKDDRDDTTLLDALSAMDTSHLDLVIVEGFKHENFPKIELHRPVLGHPLLCSEDSSIIALASDVQLAAAPDIPQLDLNNASEIAEFIVSATRKGSSDEPIYAA
ncbi:MAG: molybdopterin-guanine dinucleotide biosynthesis protein B [Thiotrichales bacterium]|nr:MAG: molybdopterin-guanine dinucleotide biosynthesis protein B [Thiotrichales bacterium]